VDCTVPHALDRALLRARSLPRVDITLQGVCEGYFLIESDNVSLRAASAGSGLAAPAGNPAQRPVLEIADAGGTVLRGLIVRGGAIGVFVHGWNGDVFLSQVDVFDQSDVGVVAYRGARARVIDSMVRDGAGGVIAHESATLNLQRVTVRNRSVGVVVAAGSEGALTDFTIENCREAGLNVVLHSSVNLLSGTFRENAQVHANANDWSSIAVSDPVTFGAAGDSTWYALTVARHATISAYALPAIYGDVGAVDGGSIRLGASSVHGNVVLYEFSDALLRSSQVLGVVVCIDGADAICKQTTTEGAYGCPSTTCGAPSAAENARAASSRGLPALRPPVRDWPIGGRRAAPLER
jgi:hypothetical protein